MVCVDNLVLCVRVISDLDADQLSDQLSETNSGASIGSESSDTDSEQ